MCPTDEIILNWGFCCVIVLNILSDTSGFQTMSHPSIFYFSFSYRWYHVVFYFIVCVRLETGYKIFWTDVLDFSKQRYFEQKWIILTLRTKYLQSLQISKAVQEENYERMFYHIQRRINNTHESPRGLWNYMKFYTSLSKSTEASTK